MKSPSGNYVARIASASPLALVVINYEMLIESIDNALRCGTFDKKSENCSTLEQHLISAKNLLAELINSLDMAYDISLSLLSIYIYLNKILAEAIRTKSPDCLPEAVKILSSLLDGWNAIANAETDTTPLMENASKIYANITYDRAGELNSYERESDDRGYTV